MTDRIHELTDRAAYRYWTREIIRLGDLDTVGHDNNNAIGVCLENGRVRMFRAAAALLRADGIEPTNDWVLRRAEIDFLAEIHYPGDLEVGTRVARFGSTSCVLEQGIFVGPRCAATAANIGVCFDTVARRGMAISEPLRQALTRLSAEGMAG